MYNQSNAGEEANIPRLDSTFENSTFDNLPSLLRRGVQPFSSYHERMIFLYSALVAFSALFFRVKGFYKQQKVSANLFLFVLAHAASGKSAMNYARKLIIQVHRYLVSNSMEMLKSWQEEKELKSDPGPRPLMQVAIIPANCSSARLIEHLMANNGQAPSVIIESELDTLTIATKSEWGNYSDIFRKAFHNEHISYSRKTDNAYYDVTDPNLAAALSGTMNQFKKFVTNAEDGLLSRFMVYSFESPLAWSSVAPCDSCVNLDTVFEPLANEVLEHYRFMMDREVEILLTKNQWDMLNDFGGEALAEEAKSNNVSSGSIVKRHGLMIFKICMVLTALRVAETKSTEQSVYCSEEDFAFALALVQLSLQNSLALLQTLPGYHVAGSTFDKDRFYNQLPSAFKRDIAVEIGKEQSVDPRTVDRALNELCFQGLLIRVRKGHYSKPEKGNV